MSQAPWTTLIQYESNGQHRHLFIPVASGNQLKKARIIRLHLVKIWLKRFCKDSTFQLQEWLLLGLHLSTLSMMSARLHLPLSSTGMTEALKMQLKHINNCSPIPTGGSFLCYYLNSGSFFIYTWNSIETIYFKVEHRSFEVQGCFFIFFPSRKQCEALFYTTYITPWTKSMLFIAYSPDLAPCWKCMVWSCISFHASWRGQTNNWWSTKIVNSPIIYTDSYF